ncbi:hypothetical protein ACHHYP_03790 [Achlya hypogyna]|uniref:Transmembrane protein n=1 Tax=Achlya hypogyna TaxID=1202772 RepID=A0A1V9Z2Y1_ACHHY|nr:hypothetical protein ACHHYP_03790 [Achlya hypogyna]
MFINLAAMPLKAYISEPFPWTPRESAAYLDGCPTNVTECAPRVLAHFKNISQTLSETAPHATDGTFDLYRLPFPLVPSEGADPHAFLLHMPYAIFFTPRERELTYALLAHSVNLSAINSVQVTSFFGVPISFAVSWAEPSTSSNIMFIGYIVAPSSREWVAIKFLYRCVLSIYIVRCMWFDYYRCGRNLGHSVAQYGVPDAAAGPVEILLGDPTSVILLNPFVSLAFLLDVWFSVEYVNRAIVRADQLYELVTFAVACVYLSRTLWFAYGALNAASWTLKQLQWTRHFRDADPTLLAIVITLAAGPITYAQSQSLYFIDCYYALFRVFASGPDNNDVTLNVLLYTVLLGLLPVVTGFAPTPRRCSSGAPPSSYRANNIKHRWATYLCLYSWRHLPVGHPRGGTVYDLFTRDPGYKRNVGMSLRGADCYILYGPVEKRSCVRVSLITSIDPHRRVLILQAKNAAFGHLRLSSDQTPTIVQGADDSPWIM